MKLKEVERFLADASKRTGSRVLAYVEADGFRHLVEYDVLAESGVAL